MVIYILIGVLIIIFGIFTFQSVKDLFSYIELKNNGIRDEATIVDVKEIDTYLPIIKLLRNYKLGDKINIFYNKNNMNIIKSDIHFNTSLKTLVLWGTCLIIMVMSLYVSFIIGKKKKIERVLMKVGMILVTVIGMCIMIL